MPTPDRRDLDHGQVGGCHDLWSETAWTCPGGPFVEGMVAKGTCNGGGSNGNVCRGPNDCPGGSCQYRSNFDYLSTRYRRQEGVSPQNAHVIFEMPPSFRNYCATPPCTPADWESKYKKNYLAMKKCCDNPKGADNCQDEVTATVPAGERPDSFSLLIPAHEPFNATRPVPPPGLVAARAISVRPATVGGSCDDNDVCTIDSGTPPDNCEHIAIECDDGEACTDDMCDELFGCQHPPADCDDGNQCTTDSCDTDEGCIHVSQSCDDGDACTVDTCAPFCQTCEHFSLAETPPPAVDNSLRVSRSGTIANLTWTGDPGPFNVYVGTRSGPWTYNMTCLDFGVAAPPVTHAPVPSPGTLFYYLVSRGTLCSESEAGHASNGSPIPHAACGP